MNSEIYFKVVRDIPGAPEGFVAIELKGSRVRLATIYKERKSLFRKPTHHWVVKTVFRKPGRLPVILGGYYETQDAAVKDGLRLLRDIFYTPEPEDDHQEI